MAQAIGVNVVVYNESGNHADRGGWDISSLKPLGVPDLPRALGVAPLTAVWAWTPAALVPSFSTEAWTATEAVERMVGRLLGGEE